MISRARLKYLRSLGRKKIRHEEGVLLVEGFNTIEEAAAAGCVRELYLAPAAADSERGRAFAGTGLPVTRLEARDVEALAETRTPAGAFALVRNPCRPFDESELPACALVLLAAGVADPGNLGTLIRTAAGLGADAVLTTPGTVEATNPKVVRASAGALFHIPVRTGTAVGLVEGGFELLLAAADGRPLDSYRERPPRLALAVGNEPHGLDAGIGERAGGTLAIPLRNGVESLNVAAAAAILLHALARLPVRAGS